MPSPVLKRSLRESSFNMTRGDEDIEGEGGLQKFLDTRKGGSEKNYGGDSKNLYTSKPIGEGGRVLKN